MNRHSPLSRGSVLLHRMLYFRTGGSVPRHFRGVRIATVSVLFMLDVFARLGRIGLDAPADMWILAHHREVVLDHGPALQSPPERCAENFVDFNSQVDRHDDHAGAGANDVLLMEGALLEVSGAIGRAT
jgi:hypothetical protein